MYGSTEDGEVGTDSVRWFVALYTGLPYTPEEDTLLPSASIAVLRERLSETELEAVRTKTITLSALREGAVEETQVEDGQTDVTEVAENQEVATQKAAAQEADTHTETEAGEVKGNTTFGELQSWGVSKQTIEQILGMPIGGAGVTVRDYCIEKGIEFSTVKGALQAAADQALGGQ
jgi:hypothetical protein